MTEFPKKLQELLRAKAVQYKKGWMRNPKMGRDIDGHFYCGSLDTAQELWSDLALAMEAIESYQPAFEAYNLRSCMRHSKETVATLRAKYNDQETEGDRNG